MDPDERTALDRARRRERMAQDARDNAPALKLTGKKEEKNLQRERRRGRMSTGFNWEEALRVYGVWCAFCGCDDEQMTVDHIIPLSRGGGNWQWNVRPLCASCNSMKGNQLDAEYPQGRCAGTSTWQKSEIIFTPWQRADGTRSVD